MAKPVKGILAKLRRAQSTPEPEPELPPQRLAALRHRAAVAEDPELAHFQPGEPVPDRGLQPIVLARRPRESAAGWGHATSWFGGRPKLGAIPWPRGADDLPLPFAAQIGLEEIAAGRPDAPLPPAGSLAFFLGEGAVIHVPAGVTQFTTPPEDLPPAYDEGGAVFPPRTTLLSCPLFPFWPVEPFALTLSPHLRDHGDSERHPAIRAAMGEALAVAGLPIGRGLFDAAEVPKEDWGGPLPVWWHGADHLIDQLRQAMIDSEQMLVQAKAMRDALRAAPPEEGGPAKAMRADQRIAAIEAQRNGLPALINALDGFAADRDPWTRLTDDERAVFVEALGNLWQQFADIARGYAPRGVEGLTTLSLRTMMTGEADAFAALPPPIRDLVNREYRLPAAMLPQMFGLAADLGNAEGEGRNALADHAMDVLLLQLPTDDMMEWRFGGEGLGAYRFWIGRAALAERRWDGVELTFESR